MKNNSFLQSVKCTVKGVASGFRAEHNFKIYTIIALVFLTLNIITSSGLYDYIILLALTCGVFSAEYINTAIERFDDNTVLQKRCGRAPRRHTLEFRKRHGNTH